MSPVEAAAWACRAAALARALDAPPIEASALTWFGEAYRQAGNADEATAAWRQAHELYGTVETVGYWPIALVQLGQHAIDHGDIKEARTWFQRADDVLARSPWCHYLHPWARAIARGLG